MAVPTPDPLTLANLKMRPLPYMIFMSRWLQLPLYLGLIALLSLGVGMIVRHTAAALSTMLAMLFVPLMIAPLLTNEHWREWGLKVSPMTAGLAVQATKGLDSLPIGPWPGLGVLAAYSGAACVLGAALFALRDA